MNIQIDNKVIKNRLFNKLIDSIINEKIINLLTIISKNNSRIYKKRIRFNKN